jgi:hypothetical protein
VYEGQVEPSRAASLVGVSSVSVIAPLVQAVPAVLRLVPSLVPPPRFQAQPLLTGLHQLLGRMPAECS